MTEYSGFWGRLATIDLGDRTSGTLEPSEEEWRRYIGGGLMAVRYLLLNTPPGLDAYHPSSPLILCSSAVAGHPFVGLARVTGVAKSPLTGGIGEARASGPFGNALKASGADGLIISGRARKPSYIVLAGGTARVIPAPELWGLDVSAVTDELRQRHGTGASVAAIGAAGERLVRFASIVTDQTHPLGRMGLGAVMGAKQLKAVVVVPDRAPAPHDPECLRRITDGYRAKIPDNVLTTEQADPPGFGAWPLSGDVTGRVGVANFSTSILHSRPGLHGDALRARTAESAGACPGCPNDCIKTFTNRVDDRAGGLDEEFLAAFARGLGMHDLSLLLDLNARCHQWGIDPVSLAGVIAFALEAQDRGLTTLPAIGGEGPQFGADAALVELAASIVRRDPSAAWLGEGVRRAAGALGPEAEGLALQVKGLEMTPFEPRTSAGLALAWAVSPLGPRYDIVEHDIDLDPLEGYPHGLDQMRALGTTEWEPMSRLDSARVMRTAMLVDLWSGLDALGVCLFAGPPMRELTTHDVARIVQAVTGWPTSAEDVPRWGRRRWHLMRLYNLREGFTAADDRLPDRFFDIPVDAGRHAGAVLGRPEFDAAVREYYDLVGWDAAGRPNPEALEALGLGWAQTMPSASSMAGTSKPTASLGTAAASPDT